jgi:hypothetical protein
VTEPSPTALRRLLACLAITAATCAAQWVVWAGWVPGWVGTVAVVAGAGALVWVGMDERRGKR